jgi:signal transduction histidine kinase
MMTAATELGVLEELLRLPATDLRTALTHACDLVASALHADKVDAFLHDPYRDSLVAVGSSNQPLSSLQKNLGLDVLPVANGGRVVWVFQTGATTATGHLEDDPDEIRGIKEALGVRSQIGVPLDVGAARRGVLMIGSRRPDAFGERDASFAAVVSRWVGLVAHRAELVQSIAESAREDGRRAVAEELMTVLAHDIRNHISPIAMRVGMLQRRAVRAGRADDARDAELVQRTVSRLETLVSEILDVARIDQGVFQMERRPFDLGALVGETAVTLSSPAHPIVAKIAERVVVAADPSRVRQCIENLLSNAIKHSPVTVTITVIVEKRRVGRGEVALVHVVDEGPGIAPELLGTIFDRFVAAPRSGGSGLGLGLHLARSIARIHGGELSVESTVGQGARFTLTLPCDGACDDERASDRDGEGRSQMH